MVIFTVVFLLCGCERAENLNSFATCKVTKIVDGDTIDVIYNGAETSVRYIGMDAPETHSGSDKPIGEYGQQAYEFNKAFIDEANDEVQLEFDRARYGNYGRLLAYIYVSHDGTQVMLNSLLLKNGLAWPLTYADTSKHTKEFWQDYRYAFEHRLGLFSKYDTAPTVPASVVDTELVSYKDGGYLGKLSWVRFGPVSCSQSSNFITLSSTYFSVTIRTSELGEFATPIKTLYAGKVLKVYGEVWEKNGKGEMLLHAPFEFKVVSEQK